MATNGLRQRFSGFWGAALPVAKWLPQYDRSWLRPDVVAGITVAAAVVPEGLAYASLANLPPETGLYAALLGVTAYLLFGTSRQVVVGPTSALALLLASSVGAVASGNPTRYVSLVALTTILVGLIAVVAWALRLGFLVNFVSGAVLTGFSAGAALYIASTQLGKLLGIEGGSGVFFERLWYVLVHVAETNVTTLAVGAVGIALLLLGERVTPRAPNALVVVLLSVLVTSVAGLQDFGVTIVGTVPSGLPTLTLPTVPDASTLATLVPVAIALFLLSYVEGIAVVETFARKHEYRTDANQELLADGMGNLAAGLGGGFVVGGSMSRSALNDSVGGKSQLTNAVMAVALIVVLLFLTGIFTDLPEATLAAVIVVAVTKLIDVTAFRRLYRVNRSEFVVAVAALVGVLVFGMLWGVFIGVAISLLGTISRVSDPRTEALERVPGTDHFVDRTRHTETEAVLGVFVYRVDAQLFYANASRVRDDLLDRIGERQSPTHLVVLDLISSPTVDLEAAEMLAELHESLGERGVDFRIAGANSQVRRLLERAGLDSRVGPIGEEEAISAVIGRWEDKNCSNVEP